MNIFKKMGRVIRQQPLYLLLLPFFFVFHGFTVNYGLISLQDALILLVTYMATTGVVYVLIWLFYRNRSRAALLTTLLLFFYFFFGTLYDFLETHIKWLHRYSIVLSVLLVLVIGMAGYLRKNKKEYTKATFFLNILLLIYLLVDAAGLVKKIIFPEPEKFSVYSSGNEDIYKPCNDCSNPDIYFLVFDEYTSSVNLSETFHYDNSLFDSLLTDRGFYLALHSYSNYHFTPFSVASILNMNYVNGIENISSISGQDYLNVERLIKNNKVINFLSARQYDVVNYSIFDLAGNPSPVEVSLLPVKTKLITEQTLLSRAMRDIGWRLNTGRFQLKSLAGNPLYNNLNINNKLLELVKSAPAKSTGKPRFIYVHFEMPHWPFYFDNQSRLRNQAVLAAEFTGVHIASYTAYIAYTNSKIMEIIDAVQSNPQRPAAIVIMGDHGYRAHLDNIPDNHFFKNLNAVYLPGKDYHLLKDTISGVNQFRLVFNTLFKQSLPLLKDSTVFLKDKIK